jgi:hypothetical protein
MKWGRGFYDFFLHWQQRSAASTIAHPTVNDINSEEFCIEVFLFVLLVLTTHKLLMN